MLFQADEFIDCKSSPKAFTNLFGAILKKANHCLDCRANYLVPDAHQASIQLFYFQINLFNVKYKLQIVLRRLDSLHMLKLTLFSKPLNIICEAEQKTLLK